MLDENSGIPLYSQLKTIVLANIQDRVWKPGDRIPTERELCGLYGVSRITVRQALRELEDDGCLARRQGKGTFVTGRAFVQRLSRFYSFSEEIRKMGAVPGAKLLSFRTETAEQPTAEKLGIREGETVLSIRRLRLADGEPFALETSHLAEESVKSLTERSVERLGLYGALRLECGVAPDNAEETFGAVSVTAKQAAFLGLEKGAAALRLERVARQGDKPVEFCVSVIRSDRYRYTVHLG